MDPAAEPTIQAGVVHANPDSAPDEQHRSFREFLKEFINQLTGHHAERL